MTKERAWTATWVLNLLVVLLIVVLDWLTPAGVVVGILLTIPIVLTSMSDHRRVIWVTFAVSATGKVLAAWHGMGPISPAAVWVPNRTIGLLALPAACAVALVLQRRRLEALRARDEALAASELSRVLRSLIAHDLRAPLGVALQALDYVQGIIPASEADEGLLDDVRIRLRRSLRTIDSLLTVARAQRDAAASDSNERTPALSGSRIAYELREEAEAFRPEAAAAGKELVVEVGRLSRTERAYVADMVVARQITAILIDNAIRHADPGPIRITGELEGGELRVRVADEGPGLSARRGEGSSGGSGLGLDLCRTLARLAGGSLEVERDAPDGSTLLLRMPAPAEEGAGGRERETRTAEVTR